MSTRAWVDRYRDAPMKYPAEWVVRIFRGSYPRMTLNLPDGARVLDVGCGDGRHLAFLGSIGLRPAGLEIDAAIASAAEYKSGWPVGVGTHDAIPFGDGTFDAALAWNTVYYMGDAPMERHVAELARVVKPGGRLVLSVPKPTCFIYRDAEPLNSGLVRITSDPFGIRNGDVLYQFLDPDHICHIFGGAFSDFAFADIHDDAFGLPYHWYVAVGRRR